MRNRPIAKRQGTIPFFSVPRLQQVQSDHATLLLEKEQAGGIIKSLSSMLELVPSENLVANTSELGQLDNGLLAEGLADCSDVVPYVTPLENGLLLNDEYLGYGPVSELVGCSLPLDKVDDFSLDDLMVPISSF